jgi:hypothetical protein
MTSYHIHDLRLLLPTDDFELRVNKHCPKVNASFREWLQESFHGDLARAEELSDQRFDLLCSLCFPTIDPPQLLRVSKLCALTFLTSDGLDHAEASLPAWLTRYVAHAEPTLETLNRQVVDSDSTQCHSLPSPEHLLGLVHRIRTRQAQELQHSSHAASSINVLRLAGNIFSLFYPPQETNTQNTYSGVLEFLAVLENAYDRKFPEELSDLPLLTTLWKHTTNIIMWSQVNLPNLEVTSRCAETEFSPRILLHTRPDTPVSAIDA